MCICIYIYICVCGGYVHNALYLWNQCVGKMFQNLVEVLMSKSETAVWLSHLFQFLVEVLTKSQALKVCSDAPSQRAY